MNQLSLLAIRQVHLVWIVTLYNMFLGVFISGYNPLAQSISEMALESPFFAYTHRAADIVIGVSMCIFGATINILDSRKFSFSMLSIMLLGFSMISAGIWTLESPLHLLYNISIFMIVVPLSFALEFKEKSNSPKFETLCTAAAFIHVFVFWSIYAGFVPREFNGLVQRLWSIVTMGWFGVAAIVVQSQWQLTSHSKMTLKSGAS